jgi:hypothetical protein
MLVPASSLVNLKKFPLGRAEFAFRQVGARSLERDLPAIAALATMGADQAAAAMAAELLLGAARTSQFPSEAGELDSLVDYGVSGLSGYCEVQVRLYHGQERASAAERVRHALLPEGVAAVTRLPYAEQHRRVAALLERAQSPALAADVALLPEMPALTERLRELNQRYGVSLAHTEDAPSREQIRAERARCQDLLAATVGMILGHFAMLPPERQADRDYLLEPILRQNDAIMAARRRNRVPRDVDPGTGVELPDEPDDQPGDEPAPPAPAA